MAWEKVDDGHFKRVVEHEDVKDMLDLLLDEKRTKEEIAAKQAHLADVEALIAAGRAAGCKDKLEDFEEPQAEPMER